MSNQMGNFKMYHYQKNKKAKKNEKTKNPKSFLQNLILSQAGKSGIDSHKNVAGLLKFSLLRGDAKEFHDSQQLLLRLYLRFPGVYVVVDKF